MNPQTAPDRESKIRRYGAAGYPALLRECWTALRMGRQEGILATLKHARTISLIRIHAMLVDRRIFKQLPRNPGGRTLLDGLTLHAASEIELKSALAHSPVPYQVFPWALRGLRIDPRAYHFVDVGSGRGFAILLASQHPLKSVTGVEFVEQFHTDALANFEWAQEKGRVKARRVEVLNESALQFRVPEEPSVLFLFNPFDGPVMDAFLNRVMASFRNTSRLNRILYLNPREHRMLLAKGFEEVPLSTRERLLLWLFGPFVVRAYRCGSIDHGVGRDCVPPTRRAAIPTT